MTTTLSCASSGAPRGASTGGTYDDLVALFRDWRAFEQPPMRDGAPDYTAATFAAVTGAREVPARLAAIDPTAWPVDGGWTTRSCAPR